MSRGGMFLHDGIGPVLDYLIINTGINVTEAMQAGAEEVQAYAQSNAPWTDRTGDARSGLYAEVYEEFGEIVLELGHSVDYGIWLELKDNGKYAIIMPTLEVLGPQIIRQAGGRVIDTDRAF
jgi:hypothetical protein